MCAHTYHEIHLAITFCQYNLFSYVNFYTFNHRNLYACIFIVKKMCKKSLLNFIFINIFIKNVRKNHVKLAQSFTLIYCPTFSSPPTVAQISFFFRHSWKNFNFSTSIPSLCAHVSPFPILPSYQNKTKKKFQV